MHVSLGFSSEPHRRRRISFAVDGCGARNSPLEYVQRPVKVGCRSGGLYSARPPPAGDSRVGAPIGLARPAGQGTRVSGQLALTCGTGCRQWAMSLCSQVPVKR